MTQIWTEKGSYKRAPYKSEADLESAIELVQFELFGPDRFLLPVKTKIGEKSKRRNIPDGYLLDLSGRQPRLFVVENELEAHDPLRHIAVQILEFSLAFESDGRGVRSVLFSALQAQPAARARCEKYAASHDYRNLDHFLEYLVFEAPFSALVIIDELPEDLENVLASSFQFGVEVIELARYESEAGEYIYKFKPFLADVAQDLLTEDAGELDTVVFPARADGVKETFLGENRWYAVRIHGTMRPQIKYAALYQVAPVSAITHFAPVKSIDPWKNTDKFVVNFADKPMEIGPIKLVKKGRAKALQNLRYTTLKLLKQARTLDDIWPGESKPVSSRSVRPESKSENVAKRDTPVIAKYISSPMVLRGKYKRKVVKAKVLRDGSIRFEGKVYNSPSPAAAAACGRGTCNGWTFWRYEKEPGEWMLLDLLRK